MSIVKPIPESDIDRLVTITANAYPGWRIESEEDRQRVVERLAAIGDDDWRNLYGLYRQDQLLGGMIYYDFDMTFVSERLPAGGVGMVAVDLLHKKEKVARDMMKAFINHFREREIPLLMLYPFRPDFYHKMGFGYGPKLNHYRFRPSFLPASGEKEKVRLLGMDDKEQVLSCYNGYADQTHGMIRRNGPEINDHFDQQTTLMVGYFDEGALLGYMAFKFELGESFLDNDLKIIEVVAKKRAARLGLLAFLRSQSDQVGWISYISRDETFHYLLSDPRNDSGHVFPPIFHESNTQGVGLMYRAIDVQGLFGRLERHRFGSESLSLSLRVIDDFVPENDGTTFLSFEKGMIRFAKPGSESVKVEISIPDFSSMIVGAVRFRDLYNLGLAKISDESCLQVVDSLFKTDRKPECLTRF